MQLSYFCFVLFSWLFIFKSTIFGTRRRDIWPIKLRNQRDLMLLQVPAPAWKKWPTNGGKTAESRESFQSLKLGILPKHWAGYYCLTTRTKRNIMKPIDVLATSWSCHFKKRCLVCVYRWAGVRYAITKFSRMDSLPNFLTHSAPLRARFAGARAPLLLFV